MFLQANDQLQLWSDVSSTNQVHTRFRLIDASLQRRRAPLPDGDHAAHFGSVNSRILPVEYSKRRPRWEVDGDRVPDRNGS
jgi:hypothetical protein